MSRAMLFRMQEMRREDRRNAKPFAALQRPQGSQDSAAVEQLADQVQEAAGSSHEGSTEPGAGE